LRYEVLDDWEKELAPSVQALLHFEEWPSRFALQISLCTSPDCSCRDIKLHLVEADEELPEGERPYQIDVTVHEETGLEEKPRERDPREAALVAELLRDLPPERLAEWADNRREERARAQRLRDKVLEPRDVVEGILVSYTHIVNPEGSVMEGGRATAYSLEHEERLFYLEDLHCCSPDCDCQEAYLFCFEAIEEDAKTARLEDVFQARIPFGGEPLLDKCGSGQRPLAEALLQAWAEKYPNQRERLERHYKRIKEVGTRSLEVAEVERGAERERLERSGERERLERRRTVGRNDSCPCGSGKKYKKCCGRGR